MIYTIFIIVSFNLRDGRIGSTSRVTLDASQGLGQGDVAFGSILRRLGGVMRIDTRSIRLICVGRSQGTMIVDLAPCYFELELGTTFYTRSYCEAIGGAG